MNKVLRKCVRFIKSFPLSSAAVTAILFATFFNLAGFFSAARHDKLLHFAAYAVMCSIFWYEYHKTVSNADMSKMLLLGVAVPVMLGGVLELLQLLSARRQCDIFDFLFNTLGVLFAFFLYNIIRR